ncbi:MAG TPA: glycosyltransferase family 4 protein [Planctomycetota bacterium]|nr:glycosyltransferase family 4 protein [Planctomycetota bacterium]
MKIALLTMNAEPGGVVSVVWQLARGLAARGHSVTVVSDGGTELEKLKAWSIPHVRVPFYQGWKGLLSQRRGMREFFRSVESDVVHSHSRWPSMVALLSGRRPDVSTLHLDRLTSHGSIFDRGFVRRALSVWGRAVTTLDESTRQKLIGEFGLGGDRVHVVPNGIDPSHYDVPSAPERAEARRRLNLADRDRVAVFVGRMVDWKQPDAAVRALAHARTSGAADAKLILCGDGPFLPEVRTLAARLGIEGDCRFLGWTDPREAYRAADFLILPSRSEGFGLVCVEGMLCGLPVLRTRCGGCDLQVIEGETGWGVDVGDDAALFERFLAAVRDPERTHRSGTAARAHALARFTEEKFLDAMSRVYASLPEVRG